MIRASAVSKSYGSRPVVRGVSLHVRPGEVMVLLGESGSGKTTLLKMINRLLEPDSGSILVDGQPVANRDPIELRRQIGYVFQDSALFPHLNVAGNIGIVPKLNGWAKTDVEERTDELLELFAMPPAEFRRRAPDQLSGGQRQRVALARALAGRPRVLLADEPFSALDPVTRSQLQFEFRRLHRNLATTTVLVTHDVVEAFLMADRIAILDDGRLLQTGAPKELLSAPAGSQVSDLLSTPLRQLERLRPLWDLVEGSPEGGGGSR